MAKNKFNQSWLHDHINDQYVKLAQREGYRARAAYKLKEIDEQDKLIILDYLVIDYVNSHYKMSSNSFKSAISAYELLEDSDFSQQIEKIVGSFVEPKKKR